ncbi:MAG: hypothetical protein ACOY37_05520 [Pseudomonadota bacterium]
MRVLLTAACVALLGCSAPDLAATAPADGAVSSASTDATSTAPSGKAASEEDAPSVAVDCGAVQARLVSGTSGPVATLARAGSTVTLARPEEMKDYQPVGIACTASNTGEPFVAVQYGEQDGCEICEWVYVYDSNGRQMNRNQPVFLNNPDLPPAQQQTPNNAEYIQLAKRLGLARPSFKFLPAR